MEIWKDVKECKGYQVSNYGRVKSLKFGKEKIRNPNLCGKYLHIILYKDGKQKGFNIHQLVAIEFLNHVPCYGIEVDHIDNNKLNNHVSNLQILTSRDNSSKNHPKSSSQYTGVTWNKKSAKWHAKILINKKRIHLGLFVKEIDAYNKYQDAKNELNKNKIQT